MKKQDILNYLKLNKRYYSDNYGVKFVGLFGSFARGDVHKDSDIDILYEIEKDKKLSMFGYLKLSKHLEEFFDKKVDLVRNDKLKPQLKRYMQEDINYV